MVKLYFFSSLLLLSTNLKAQYCTDAGPSSAADSNVESVFLSGDSNDISHTGCPGVIGVEDLTNLSADLTANNTYTIDIQFGTCNGNYAGFGEAWIDFNQNEVFEPNESIGTWSGTPPVSISNFNFMVPAASIDGTTRLRVMHREGGSSPLDPCDQYSWGSIMDFSIEISGGFDCSPYTGDDRSDPIIVPSVPYTNAHNSSICYSSDNNAYASPDVFYLILPTPELQTLTVSLCGSSFDTFLSVFDTDTNTVAFNDDGSCGSQSEITFSTVGYDSLYVIVEGWGNESGDYTIEINGDFLNIDDHNSSMFNIYPNPSKTQFSILGLKTDQLSISNLSGQSVQTISNYNGEAIIINQLSKGLYFVSYKIDNTLHTQKLIIE